MDAVPIPSRAPAANGEDAIVIFDRAELDVVFVVSFILSERSFQELVVTSAALRSARIAAA